MFSSQNIRARAKILLPLAASVSGLLFFATPAFAGVAGSVAPDYPNPVTAGQTGLAAKLTITNSSTAGNAANSVGVTTISHTPSCGSSLNNTCMGADIDTGVFTVHSGTGEVGTACAGVAFTAGAPDGSGKVIFTPGSAITLGPSSGPLLAAQCIIDFTVDVLKVPTKDASVAAGMQTDQLGSAQFQDLTTLGIATGSGSNEITVKPAAPSIGTTPSAGGPVGTVLNDTATLSGGSGPTGNVVFNLYAPSDATCSAAAAYTSTDGTAPYASTPGFTSNAVGVWHWTASYAGDANNNATSSPCASETVTTTKASPTISTTPSTGGPIGTILNDTATLSGGASPTGSVTFKLFAPSDTACDGTAVYTDTDPTAPYATSPGFTSLVAGTYHWTADYAGDANNNPVSSGCQDEPVTTTKASPTISTTPSAGGPIGTVLNDTATLSGGSGPTGNVVFNLYAPADATCSATAVFTSTDGTAPYASTPGFTSNAVGVWHWTASYAGDANNNATSSPCAAETVTTTLVTPTIATTLSTSSVSVGAAVHDSAALTGATANAGGTVIYKAYTDGACTAGAQSAGTKTVTAGVVPDSDPITFNTAGTYNWQAVYSGDANNAAATSTCGTETLVVNKARVTVATTLSGGSVTVGTAVHDSATLTGATATAGGTATYTVYTDNACSLGAMDAGTKTVTNGSVPNSNNVTFSSSGTFYWQVVYSGDTNNLGAMSACQTEILGVNKFAPLISTTLSTTTTATTTPVHDSATLSGASSDAGGTATYSVFTNASCTTGTMSAGVKTVVGGVVPDSDPLTFATPGTYYWQVAYSGDAKNAAATSSCRSEILTITAPPPPPTGCLVDWKPVGNGWMDFGPLVSLNRGGRLLSPNNPCVLKLPLRFSPGPIKPQN